MERFAPPEPRRRRTDLLIFLMQGAAHNHITISGYPWSAPDRVLGDLIQQWAREAATAPPA